MNKICTDILQSKKLAEILPLESADMYYSKHTLENYYSPIPNIGNYSTMHDQIPCWSISALLEIIRNNGRYELQMFDGGYYFEANGFMTESYFNPVDTCYEFILKLHELNLRIIVPKSIWISVKEKLPYNNPNFIHFGFTNKVLVREKNGNVFVAYMKKNKDNEWIWCNDMDDNFNLLSDITHWMHIPEAPKE